MLYVIGVMQDVLLGTDIYPQRLLKTRLLMVKICDPMCSEYAMYIMLSRGLYVPLL